MVWDTIEAKKRVQIKRYLRSHGHSSNYINDLPTRSLLKLCQNPSGFAQTIARRGTKILRTTLYHLHRSTYKVQEALFSCHKHPFNVCDGLTLIKSYYKKMGCAGNSYEYIRGKHTKA
jgi:hypothetical protein